LIHEALLAARVPLTCGVRVPLRESVSLLSRRINAQSMAGSRCWSSDVADAGRPPCTGGFMIARLGLIATLLTTLAAGSAMAQSATAPAGTWLTQAGDAKVKVTKCGGALCGAIVWLREPIDAATGKPQIDDKNANPALAKRSIKGLTIFSDMRRSGPGKWSGHIYNADDGKTYESSLAWTGPTTLRVEGCVGALCGSETWTASGK
jgi:uncharacterized protein (DUF2147 family)